MTQRWARPAFVAAGVVVAAAVLVAVVNGAIASDEVETAATTTRPAAPSPAEITSFTLATDLVDTGAPGGELADDRSTPKVNVLLPEGYHDDLEEQFPVLWLLHGAAHGVDAWADGIEELADDMGAIVVMPDGGRYGMYADWFSDGERGDPAWATFHLETLRDEIESRFRVRDGRQWHALAGVSMGGQGALRYAAMLPGYFGSVATFSAAMPDMQSPIAEVQVDQLARGAATYEDVFGPPDGAYAEGSSPAALVSNLEHTRVFVTSGDGTNCAEDPVNDESIANDGAIETVISREQASFVEAALAAGVDVTASTTCGVHTFGVWDRAFLAAREWDFFEAVPEAPEQWSFRTVATTGEVWGLPYSFAEPPTDVVSISRTGHTLRAEGTGALTLGDGDCRISGRLPFSATLPTGC